MALVEETMKTRLLGALVGLAISFALPTYAQQKDVADPQTTQKILALMKAVNETQNNNDPAPESRYTRAMRLLLRRMGAQSSVGKPFRKWFTDVYQW